MYKLELELAGSITMLATQDAVQAFTKVAGVPTVASARLFPDSKKNGLAEVEARWTQRDLERGKKVAFSKSYFIQSRVEAGLEAVCSTSYQADATAVLKVTYASDCLKKCVLLKDKPAKADSSAEPQQYIEVWNGGSLLKTIDVKSLKKHGKIHEDDHFGSFQFSANGDQLLYIAEREKPKNESFFKKDSSNKPSNEDKPIEKGTEYVFDPSWGEQLTSVVNPVPVLLDVNTEECTVLDMSSIGDISAAQAQWVPGEEGGIVFVGYENKPRKLGFVYCFNRRSALYYANITKGTHNRLTDNDHTFYSPRFNPQGTKLAYFETVGEGPHRSCAKLNVINWSDKVVTIVIDTVDTPKPPDNFPGFYAVSFPPRCWDKSGRVLVLSTQWGSYLEVTVVDVERSKVTRMPDKAGKRGTWVILDVSCDLVLAQFSNPNTTPQLCVGELQKGLDSGCIEWTLVASPSDPTLTKDLKWELLNFQPSKGEDIPYEALLLHPPSSRTPDTKSPLVVFPHGGPHGVYTADFYVWPVSLNLIGYTVLLVNYRGSTGFGQKSIDSLLGNVGTQDVNDVQDAAVYVVNKGLVDKERVVVMGGSHGGFLTNHILGQFPDFYKAGCALNPVTCFPSNTLVSDIPEWSYVEAGLTFDPAKPPTADDLAKLLSVSPIVHTPKIKAPLLFVVGGKDLRCPPSQSFAVYHLLKAMDKETKLLFYPEDCHPIMSVVSNSDAFVNLAAWFAKYAPSQE